MQSGPIILQGSVENIVRRIQIALPILLEAYHAGEDVDADNWDFAVEIEELRRLGITLSDLRWLVCKNYVEHAEESGVIQRRFRRRGRLSFTKRSCFILTDEGKRWADSQLCDAVAEYDHVREETAPPPPAPLAPSANGANGHGALRATSASMKPCWDAETRQLFLGDAVVKEFRSPAMNQVRIITAFDELAWPRRIDDPLPPTNEIEPKKRLHDTINAFNRNQKSPLIRFKGDGTGEGIMWELMGSPCR